MPIFREHGLMEPSHCNEDDGRARGRAGVMPMSLNTTLRASRPSCGACSHCDEIRGWDVRGSRHTGPRVGWRNGEHAGPRKPPAGSTMAGS